MAGGHVFFLFLGALFATANPIGNIAIFLSLTETNSSAERRRIAFATCLAVLIILVVTAVGGRYLLELFGISIAAFRTAGGMMILLIGLSMLHAKKSAMHHGPDEHEEGVQKDNPAIFPLAIPIVAGPGTIATVLVYSHGQSGLAGYGIIIAGILVITALLGLCFVVASPLGRWMGKTGMNVATRIMGMVLAAIAVEMMAAGLRGLFPSLGAS